MKVLSRRIFLKKISIVLLRLETDRKISEPASKLRGYIGNSFPDYPILHHHIKEGFYLYTYPRVQYKILEGVAIILGIEEGGEVVKRISNEIRRLNLGKNTYEVFSIKMTEKFSDFGFSKEEVKYRFVTPWLALNQSNYKHFKETRSWKVKKELLNGILIGNILSMSKGFDYVVRGRLHARSLLDIESVDYKGVLHIGFTGDFTVNFVIPEYLGLGSGVSQGFGTIVWRF